MTIPTKEWFPTDITGDLGSYESWDLGTIDAEAMIVALCDALAVFVPATWSFDEATIYTQASPTSPNIPRRSKALGIDGTSVSTGYAAAISTTWNFKTLDNGNARLVLLDTPLGAGGFAPILPADFDANIDLVVTEFCASANAWSGRDDTKPNECRKVSFDLNDKLQKLYHLV